ncbi:helix-turn-helix domain-containing protein [Longispora sp. NPDC051575]|uniref:helix-turn-helix domain-containing protein n=1 Tax=Longispora sp. NPDC051575 TaxID=3154943 RepID=UPI0034308F61
MVRPEKKIDPCSGPIAAFAVELRELRRAAGEPPYKAMAKSVNFSSSALSKAAAGDRLPTWDVTSAYVRACGGQVAAWKDRWAQAHSGHSPLNLFGPVQVKLLPDDLMPGPARPRATPVHELADIAGQLDAYRQHARLSWRALAARTKESADASLHLSSSTLYDALIKRRRPTLPLTLRVAELCGATPDELADWERAWRRATAKDHGLTSEQPVIEDRGAERDLVPVPPAGDGDRFADQPGSVPAGLETSSTGDLAVSIAPEGTAQRAHSAPAPLGPTPLSAAISATELEGKLWWRARFNIYTRRRDRLIVALCMSYVALGYLMVSNMATGMTSALIPSNVGKAIVLAFLPYCLLTAFTRFKTRRMSPEAVQARALRREAAERRSRDLPPIGPYNLPKKLTRSVVATAALCLVGILYPLINYSVEPLKPRHRQLEPDSPPTPSADPRNTRTHDREQEATGPRRRQRAQPCLQSGQAAVLVDC